MDPASQCSEVSPGGHLVQFGHILRIDYLNRGGTVEKSSDSKTFKVYECTFLHSTAAHSLSCLTYRVYNQSQSISPNHRIVNHYEDLHFMNI